MKVRQVFIDTETTGLSAKYGHRVIELAAVETIDGELTGRVLHSYFDPECPIDPNVEKLIGISAKFLIGKPKFKDFSKSLIDFLAGAECITHNA